MSGEAGSSSMGATSANAARTPGTRRTPGARRTPASPLSASDVLAVLGFACLLTALLVYSASAMPFQRFATLPGFISVMGSALRVCAGASLLVALAVAFGAGRFVRSLPARAVFSVALALGNAMFCAMALAGAWDAWTFWYVGGCIGIGCIGVLLSWGRVLSRYNLRQATGVVAASSVLAVLFGCVQLSLPEPGAVAFFMACTVAACALPFVLGDCRNDRRGGGKADVGKGDASPGASPGASPSTSPTASSVAQTPADGTSPVASLASRVRAFLEVTLVPGIGLALFAMLMAMRGQYFFETYSQYVLIQIAVAALLLACMLLPASVPLLRTVYRGLIPLLSVAVLAFNYMSEALFGGSEYEMILVIVLYTAAALLTITTLVGMAHAAEFSSDLVVSIACMLFCAVSVATMVAAPRSGLSDSDTRAVIVTSSGLYAAGMVVLALWRGLRADRDALLGLELDRPRPKGWPAGSSAAPTDQPAATVSTADGLLTEAGIEARCDSLAREYALTAREREVLGYLAHGHNGVYISDELLISPNTVRTHIHNIYRKLGVTSREDVLRATRG